MSAVEGNGSTRVCQEYDLFWREVNLNRVLPNSAPFSIVVHPDGIQSDDVPFMLLILPGPFLRHAGASLVEHP